MIRRIVLTSVGVIAIAAAASAADMYVPGPTGPGYKDVDVPVASWGGFYVGVNAGWADNVISAQPNEHVPATDGFAGGGQIGYNWQGFWHPHLVLGIEADIDGLTLDKTEPCANPRFNCQTTQDWMATVRGRIGFAFDRALIYGTGGVAFSELRGETSFGSAHFPDSKDLTGYVAGGGVEYQITPHFIGRVEYLFADFGKNNFVFDGPYPGVGDEVNIVRAGLSYKFGSIYEPLK